MIVKGHQNCNISTEFTALLLSLTERLVHVQYKMIYFHYWINLFCNYSNTEMLFKKQKKILQFGENGTTRQRATIISKTIAWHFI